MRSILVLLVVLGLTQPSWGQDLIYQMVLTRLSSYSYFHPLRARALWALVSMLAVAGFLWGTEAVERGALKAE